MKETLYQLNEENVAKFEANDALARGVGRVNNNLGSLGELATEMALNLRELYNRSSSGKKWTKAELTERLSLSGEIPDSWLEMFKAKDQEIGGIGDFAL